MLSHFRTTWVYSYYDIIFPENYADLWCGFDSSEVFVIKTALRGSLLLGLAKGKGQTYNKFVTDYADIAENVVGSVDKKCATVDFVHTGYIRDSLYVVANAMHRFVNDKASSTNKLQKDITISRMDHRKFTNYLLQSEVDGVTGSVRFTEERKRDFFSFVIRNFVPKVKNFSFSEEVAFTEDPWILETKGVIVSEGDNFKFTFFDADGEKTNTSTVIFADGSAKIPRDKPTRLYIRGDRKSV